MADINYEINRLLNFAVQNGLITEDDMYYSANLLLDVLKAQEFTMVKVEEKLPTATPILLATYPSTDSIWLDG